MNFLIQMQKKNGSLLFFILKRNLSKKKTFSKFFLQRVFKSQRIQKRHYQNSNKNTFSNSTRKKKPHKNYNISLI